MDNTVRLGLWYKVKPSERPSPLDWVEILPYTRQVYSSTNRTLGFLCLGVDREGRIVDNVFFSDKDMETHVDYDQPLKTGSISRIRHILGGWEVIKREYPSEVTEIDELEIGKTIYLVSTGGISKFDIDSVTFNGKIFGRLSYTLRGSNGKHIRKDDTEFDLSGVNFMALDYNIGNPKPYNANKAFYELSDAKRHREVVKYRNKEFEVSGNAAIGNFQIFD